MYNRTGEVMVFDIAHVLRYLAEHPCGQLKLNRGLVPRKAIYQRMEMAHSLEEALIDDFLCYAINAFQFIWICGFNPNAMTPDEIRWFQMNENASTALWLTLRPLTKRFSGEMVGYARSGNLLILYLPTE
jgi:hypothetical protein